MSKNQHSDSEFDVSSDEENVNDLDSASDSDDSESPSPVNLNIDEVEDSDPDEEYANPNIRNLITNSKSKESEYGDYQCNIEIPIVEEDIHDTKLSDIPVITKEPSDHDFTDDVEDIDDESVHVEPEEKENLNHDSIHSDITRSSDVVTSVNDLDPEINEEEIERKPSEEEHYSEEEKESTEEEEEEGVIKEEEDAMEDKDGSKLKHSESASRDELSGRHVAASDDQKVPAMELASTRVSLAEEQDTVSFANQSPSSQEESEGSHLMHVEALHSRDDAGEHSNSSSIGQGLHSEDMARDELLGGVLHIAANDDSARVANEEESKSNAVLVGEEYVMEESTSDSAGAHGTCEKDFSRNSPLGIQQESLPLDEATFHDNDLESGPVQTNQRQIEVSVSLEAVAEAQRLRLILQQYESKQADLVSRIASLEEEAALRAEQRIAVKNQFDTEVSVFVCIAPASQAALHQPSHVDF